MNIKSIRKNKGLTQRELSNKSGVSYSMVSKLESGEKKNPSMDTLIKIATALEVPIQNLWIIDSSSSTLKQDIGTLGELLKDNDITKQNLDILASKDNSTLLSFQNALSGLVNGVTRSVDGIPNGNDGKELYNSIDLVNRILFYLDGVFCSSRSELGYLTLNEIHEFIQFKLDKLQQTKEGE